MRLPEFEYLTPADLEEALAMLAEHHSDAAVLAGGTDLLVRMKQRLAKPACIVSLKNLAELNYIRRQDDHLAIGAATPLVELLQAERVNENHYALLEAIRRIGAPPIQHFRGTIGGNLCLQTRCLYYNQSAFWRSGRTCCHKDGGEICYAEENSDRCRSANQSDGACALTALEAGIELASVRGRRILPIEEFFTARGEAPFAMQADELVSEIRLPLGTAGQASSFQKLTYRSAIDFTLVSAAAAVRIKKGQIAAARIAVGGAGAAPLLLKEAARALTGKSTSDNDAVTEVAKLSRQHAGAFMVDNLGAELEYRRKMAALLVKRAVTESLARAS